MESNRSANGDHRLAGGMVLGSVATAGGIYGHNAIASNGGYRKTYNQGKDFTAKKAGNAIDGALDTLVKMRMRGK